MLHCSCSAKPNTAEHMHVTHACLPLPSSAFSSPPPMSLPRQACHPGPLPCHYPVPNPSQCHYPSTNPSQCHHLSPGPCKVVPHKLVPGECLWVCEARGRAARLDVNALGQHGVHPLLGQRQGDKQVQCPGFAVMKLPALMPMRLTAQGSSTPAAAAVHR